jgi:hypothetical protein
VQPLPQPAPVPAPAPYPVAPPYGYRKRRSPFLATVLAGGGLMLVIAIVAALLWPRPDAGTGGPSSTSASADAVVDTTPAPLPLAEAGTSANAPAPVGTDVAPAKGWTVKVTAADLDADATMARASIFSKPGPGKQFVMVSLTTGHSGARAATLLAEMKLSLRTTDGTTHGASWWHPTPDRLNALAQVPPGGSISGNLAFEVPEAGVNGAVLLAEPLFTLNQAKDQRFLALQ